MKSRMSSWASFFTLGGMSPSTCRGGEVAQGLVLMSSSLWPSVWPRVLLTVPTLAPPHTSLRLGFFMGKRGLRHHLPGS